MKEYMNIAIKLAQKAYKNGDIPVGAVIVKKNKIISKGKFLNALNRPDNKKQTWRAPIHINECVQFTKM